jgi:signal transduction histidine kinase/ActR/RegA family two-component response regulator
MSGNSQARTPVDSPLTRQVRAAILCSQTYVFIGALVSLIGWAADLPRLTDWNNIGISIQPNAAIAAISASAALILMMSGFRRAAAILGALVTFIGASVLFQYLTGTNLGIDTLLMFDRSWGRVGVLVPGRMGPAGATSWTLIGTALLLSARSRKPKAEASVLVLAVLTASLSSLSLVGYLYGASSLYTIPTLTVIALQTATFIFAASLGLVMSVSERGLMRLLRDKGPAGILVRRVTPAVIGVPILLGFFRLMGERAGLYDHPFGTALRSMSEIGLFLLLLWKTATAISMQATRKAGIEQALREREKALNEAQRLAHVGDWEWDADTDENIVSDEVCRIFGLPPGKPIPAFKDQDGVLFPHESWARLNHAVQECLRTGRGYEVDVEGLRNGERIWITTRSEVVRDDAGRIKRLRGTVQDISERKLIETAREQAFERERAARAEAERAGRVKDDFLATVSHELRTPLTAILGWSHFLKRDIADAEKARKAAEVIERNGRLQAQLITDLLDMSRILSGKMRLDVQSVDLPRVIDAAIESILPAADAKGLRIQRIIDPLSEAITGDPGRIQQVVWNLLSNAVKFTPRGGRVEVMLTRINSHVEIRVTDSGEGISAEFLPYVFDRFRQADSSTSRTHGGLGIGLALVKEFVELHGGTVRAASSGKGQGTTFVIELPGAIVSDDESLYSRVHPNAQSGEITAGVPLRLSGIKVLVVEDEPDALAIVRRALEDSDAEVGAALSAGEALEILTAETFDVIISDIGMPVQDGYALIAEVRTRGIQTPAVALTAFARTEDRTRSLLSGYQAHVSKPVEIPELLATVASLAQRKLRATNSLPS